MSSPPGYDALLHGAALIRRTDRGVVRLRGADRATWLQGLVTNDVSALSPVGRVYSAYLTPQGRMITDLWVVATNDALWLDVPAPLAASLASRLDGLIFAEDVQIDDVSESLAVLQVFGAAGAVAADVAALPDLTFGIPSTAVYVTASALDAFVAALPASSVEASLDALEVLRIEAGVPRFLVDMTDDTIPLEAGIEDRAISFTKGCYVGQEIIVRVTTRGGGRVARRLVGLAFGPGTTPPAGGATIHASDRIVGRVTSAVFSPRCSRVIGLGYVHRDFVDPGTPLEVHDHARREAVTVHALPFVPPRT